MRIQNTDIKKCVSFDSLPNFEARSNRSIQLGRPLDFAMVSDHAEFFGELRVCGEAARDSKDGKSKVCKGLRKNFPAKGMKLVQDYLAGINVDQYRHNNDPMRRKKFCGKKGEKCLEGAKVGWKEVIDSAESVMIGQKIALYLLLVMNIPRHLLEFHRNALLETIECQRTRFSYGCQNPEAPGINLLRIVLKMKSWK